MSPSADCLQNRDLRQRDLVPPARLAACHAVVMGVGAIGRQAALQLAAVGVPLLILFDDDVVAEENLAPQGYRPDQLGMSKVDATALDCQRVNPCTHTIPKAERFRRTLARQVIVGSSSLVVFCCVDSITTLRLIWESLHNHTRLCVDGRMSAEVIRVLAVDVPAADRGYATTLFGGDEAYAGSCTARSTIYAASIAAGLIVGQFTKWLRDLPVEPDLMFNLLAMELTSSEPTP